MNNNPDFHTLINAIQNINTELTKQASYAVNLSLTLRNWCIGTKQLPTPLLMSRAKVPTVSAQSSLPPDMLADSRGGAVSGGGSNMIFQQLYEPLCGKGQTRRSAPTDDRAVVGANLRVRPLCVCPLNDPDSEKVVLA